MTEDSFQSLRNGIIGTVIGGLIVYDLTIGKGITLIPFKWLWSCIVWGWTRLLDTYTLPGWLLAFTLIMTFIGLALIYISLREKRKDHNVLEPPHENYTEDYMFGAKWRWKWNRGGIGDLWAYCPTCDATLVYDDSFAHLYSNNPRTKFICEHCDHRTVAEVRGGNKAYAIGAVKREIGRRVRTREWSKLN